MRSADEIFGAYNAPRLCGSAFAKVKMRRIRITSVLLRYRQRIEKLFPDDLHPILRTLDICSIDTFRHVSEIEAYMPCGTRDCARSFLYRQACAERECGLEDQAEQKFLYLALHGHTEACYVMMGVCASRSDDERKLWFYWLDRRDSSCE